MTLLFKNQILLYSLLFLLGLISSFSLPPYNFFFLNFLSYPTLLLILLKYSKNKFKSFSLGWIFGFGYFLSNLYWITNSLTFEDIFKPLIPCLNFDTIVFRTILWIININLFTLSPKKIFYQY